MVVEEGRLRLIVAILFARLNVPSFHKWEDENYITVLIDRL